LTDYSPGLAPASPGLSPLWRDCTLDELRHRLAAAGVRAAVLVQTVPVAAEMPTIADAADKIAGVVGRGDLCAAGGRSSDGQAKVFGATTAAWHGFGATDHDRAGRPCG